MFHRTSIREVRWETTGEEIEMAYVTNGDRASEAPIADLTKQLSVQASRLAHLEIELAKSELAAKGKRAGIGAGMFGGAGVFGFYALGALTAAAILGLATGLASWLAALIVGAALGGLAACLGLSGKKKVQQATPPIPEQASESVKEDVRWAKTRAQTARR
jgi:membrane protein